MNKYSDQHFSDTISIYKMIYFRGIKTLKILKTGLVIFLKRIRQDTVYVLLDSVDYTCVKKRS